MSHPSTLSGDSGALEIIRTGGVATLRFNRPRAINAIDVPMANALLDAATRLAADDSVRAIVLCGAGKGFMAGGDLETLQRDPQGSATALLKPLNQALKIFTDMDAPLVAQVHGVAAGAGMSLMLQADFIIAAEGTRFNLAYINIGASCDAGASWALPRLAGLRRALEIAMLGETIDTETAYRLGLINQIVTMEALDPTVGTLAARLAQGPTQAYGAMRRLMRSAFAHTLEQQLDEETATFRQCVATDDFRSGVEAFFAKKKPVFSGR